MDLRELTLADFENTQIKTVIKKESDNNYRQYKITRRSRGILKVKFTKMSQNGHQPLMTNVVQIIDEIYQADLDKQDWFVEK